MDRSISPSWEETYESMAAEQESWSDFECVLLDGLDNDEFDSEAIGAMYNRHKTISPRSPTPSAPPPAAWQTAIAHSLSTPPPPQ
jgi:hypothetical protein